MKTHKNNILIRVEKNSFRDDGEGVISFPQGLTITDDSEQRNGTRYDIKSMDISEYSGMLTADHSMSITDIIGKVNGTRKVASRRVVVDSIQFAIKENAVARLAYDLARNGYLTDYSIETFGPYPNDDGIYENSKLIGLSAVVVGNNRSATVNNIVLNSIEESKQLNLDTSIVEDNFVCYDEKEQDTNNSKKENTNMFKTIKNTRDFAVTVTYKNAAGDDVEKTLDTSETVDVSEDQATAVEAQIEKAEAPKAESVTAEAIKDIVTSAIAPMTQKIAELEKQAFDKSAQEPKFEKKAETKMEVNKNNWQSIHEAQVANAWAWKKGGSQEAANKLRDLNKINLEKLQESGRVSNTVTLEDFGNFVISPELLTKIEGFRSNFTPLVSRLDYRETMSLQFSYLKRSGDIAMSELEMCDDGADGNLKPISEYGATLETANLHELAAVTPVCNAATRFSAADLLGDVAAGYRNDYERKLAQLFIARLQQAVNETGNKTPYNGTSDTTTLKSWFAATASVSEEVMNGVLIFNHATLAELKSRAIGAGISGPLSQIFTTGDLPAIDGLPYIVVPNELLPTLNTTQTKSFTVEGAAVTINQAVFYVDLSTFTGRTSGGLQYDLSTEASYEDGGTTKSAYQRNELLLRGSFFRGGAVKDADMVASIYAAGVS